MTNMRVGNLYKRLILYINKMNIKINDNLGFSCHDIECDKIIMYCILVQSAIFWRIEIKNNNPLFIGIKIRMDELYKKFNKDLIMGEYLINATHNKVSYMDSVGYNNLTLIHNNTPEHNTPEHNTPEHNTPEHNKYKRSWYVQRKNKQRRNKM